MSTLSGIRVLVVDDDDDVRALVGELLGRAGARVREAHDGREALKVLFDARPDLIVLDVAMPDLDGWQTLERIRDMTDVPVLMLTARDNELEKVRGLQGGADDYVTKPFGRQELLARCAALVRRTRRVAGAGGPEVRETHADSLVHIDVANARVEVAGVEVTLTPLEFRLLLAFVRHPEQVLNRDQLLELVWGDSGAVASEQVKLYVGYLRRKLEPAIGAGDGPIETVRGFGYRYRPGAVSWAPATPGA
jgi:DNA-binding response OmpR family regulator